MNLLSFAKSSKKAWNLLHRLNGKTLNRSKVYPISAEGIAVQLFKNSQGSVYVAANQHPICRHLLHQAKSMKHLSRPTLIRSISSLRQGVEKKFAYEIESDYILPENVVANHEPFKR